jgi:hypothetical protein
MTRAKSELATSRMRCSTNHFGNLSVVFYVLSEFEYIISDIDVRRGKVARADCRRVQLQLNKTGKQMEFIHSLVFSP